MPDKRISRFGGLARREDVWSRGGRLGRFEAALPLRPEIGSESGLTPESGQSSLTMEDGSNDSSPTPGVFIEQDWRQSCVRGPRTYAQTCPWRLMQPWS